MAVKVEDVLSLSEQFSTTYVVLRMCTCVQNSSHKPRLNMHDHLFRPQAVWLLREDALKYRSGVLYYRIFPFFSV